MIEYKTFLFDLILQERFDEFHKVKPIDAPLGVDSNFYNLFMHDYFFHPAFDEFGNGKKIGQRKDSGRRKL